MCTVSPLNTVSYIYIENPGNVEGFVTPYNVNFLVRWTALMTGVECANFACIKILRSWIRMRSKNTKFIV